ncbi:MAG: fibronectin type III domain-containing protein [Bacillota bacterium]
MRVRTTERKETGSRKTGSPKTQWPGHVCLILGLFLILSSASSEVARAGLGTISLTSIEAYNWDGSPGSGTVDFGTVYPGSPAVVSRALVFNVSSDLEWRLRGWTGAALPAGCLLEQRPRESGGWVALSPSGAVIRPAENPCPDGGSFEDDLRLTVDFTLSPGTYTIELQYEVSFTDQTPPAGTVVINGGAGYTNDPVVTLDLSATDDSGVVDSVSFSDDGSTWSAWQDYATTVSYTLADPGADGTKTVWARFRDRAGNVSSPASDSIILDTVPPAISELTVAGVTSTTANIAWQTDEPATSQVKYRPDGASSWSLSPLGSAYELSHTVSLADLTPGTRYFYRALSADRAGNLTESAEASFWTPCEAPYLSASVTQTGGSFQYQVNLSWTSSTNATGYKVYRKDVSTGTTTLLTTTTATSYTDNVEARTVKTLEYWVAAVNGAGTETSSNVVTVTLGGDDATPPVLTITSVTPGQTECVITWTTDEPSTSRIAYRVKGTGTYSETPLDTTLVTDHSVTVTGLTQDTTYEFYAVSSDAAGNTGQSDVGEFTTLPPGVPPAPQNLRVTKRWPRNQFVTLAWDPADTAVEYTVYRRYLSDPPTAWEECGRTSDTTIKVGFLNPAQPTYTAEYYVTAWNALGESDPSNIVTVVP